MKSAIINLPEQHQDFAAAREVLRYSGSTRAQLSTACDVLSASNNWMDIRLVSMTRNALWANDASELLPDARAIYNDMAFADLGQNAGIFAAMNTRKRDRWVWIAAGVCIAVLIIGAVL